MAGYWSGRRCPSTRICGGEFVVMWRSDPPWPTISFRSWFNVGGTAKTPRIPKNLDLLVDLLVEAWRSVTLVRE
jgi:hypothetical protein